MTTLEPPSQEKIFSGIFKSPQSEFKAHDKGLTAFFNAFVALMALSLSRQDSTKDRYGQDVSIFDLGPLYGITPQETDMVRAKEGRGMLAPDCFFEPNVSKYPPAVAALLVLWNRNHNYIARQLLFLNQSKKWNDPSDYEPFDDAHKNLFYKQDEEIFQIARLINSIQFKNTVETDFLKVVAGDSINKSTVSTSKVALPPSKRGDQLTSSFQLLYKYWTPFCSEDEVEFYETQREQLDQPAVNPDPKVRNFQGLERGASWRFKDEALANILMDATSSAAGNPTSALSDLVKDDIEAARHSGAAGSSLNSFRKFLGLQELKKFEAWNSDPRIAEQSIALYSDISNLELYVGLMAERIPEPNSSLRPVLGETLSKALLADLATFIEADPGKRFTEGVIASNLTTWGVEDCKASPKNGAGGAWLPRLLQRNLPHHYTYNSVFSLFPFFHIKNDGGMIPESDEPLYEFDRPHSSPVKIVNTKSALDHVFKNPEKYGVMYDEDVKLVSNGYGFFLGHDNISLHDKDLMMTMFALHPDAGAGRRYAEFFGKTASRFIMDASSSGAPSNTANGASKIDTSQSVEIDIVAEVINKTCTRWVCQTLCGIDRFGEPAKQTPQTGPQSVISRLAAMTGADRAAAEFIKSITPVAYQKPKSEEDWHKNFGHLYALVFRNGDPQHGWETREKAKQAADTLFKYIERQMRNVAPRYLATHHFEKKSFLERWVYHYSDKAKATYFDVHTFGKRLLLEYFVGQTIPQFNSAVFLERMLRSSRRSDFALGSATLEVEALKSLAEQVMNADASGDFAGWEKNKARIFQIIQREDALQAKRVVANIVGLAMATAIHYAQACALAVDFYLAKEREPELEDIRRLIRLVDDESRDDAIREDANKKLMGYFREAQRIGQPFGVWRKAKEDDIIPGSNVRVKKGDKIYIDFGTYHMSDEFFEEPHKIKLDRKVPSLQGLGLHKCPGMSFVDNTMPELFKAIFRLKNLRPASENGRLVRLHCHSPALPSDPRLFWDPKEGMSPYPRTLKLAFEPEPIEPPTSLTKESTPANDRARSGAMGIIWSIWEMIVMVLVLLKLKEPSQAVPQGKSSRSLEDLKALKKPKKRSLEKIFSNLKRLSKLGFSDDRRKRLRNAMNTILVTIILLFFGFQVLRLIIFLGRSVGLLSRKAPRVLVQASDIKRSNITCPSPKMFDSPHIENFVPGPDGEPLPITYTLDDTRTHKLSFVDIDEKDTRMAVWVDEDLRGLTADFVVNKTLNCGEDLNLCLRERFSAGMVIVPGGKHTVKIEWQGNEFLPNSTEMNWGEQKFRRIKLWKEWCN